MMRETCQTAGVLLCISALTYANSTWSAPIAKPQQHFAYASVSFAARAPVSTAPTPVANSWMVESGIYLNMNASCGAHASAADVIILSNVVLAGAVNPFFRNMERSDDALLEAMRHPGIADQKTVNEQRRLYRRITDAIQRRHASNARFCTPDLTDKIASFANRAVLAGIADEATRVIGIMAKNRCKTLGCS